MFGINSWEFRRSALATVFGVVLLFSADAAIPLSAQTLTTLFTFTGVDGSQPTASVVRGLDGNFYGTTYYGGAHGEGVAFVLNPNGTSTVLHHFCSQPNCADGGTPSSNLVQDASGVFYGTTPFGSIPNDGTIYTLTPGGQLTTLQNFANGSYHGVSTQPALILASDGNFYGTTDGGGSISGTIFRLTPDGTFTTLYNFCSLANCADGASPDAALVQATDGNFYGTTANGGIGCHLSSGCGTVFKMTPSGALTTLYSFCPQLNCLDGLQPQTSLAQGGDGYLYGTTSQGGIDGHGTAFKISGSGAFTLLHGFVDDTDGGNASALIQATDGNFYGTAQSGGSHQSGTIFKISSTGTFTVIYNFDYSDGDGPAASLVQAPDGMLYGTTEGGGTSHSHGVERSDTPNPQGTVFSLSVGLSPFVETRPTTGYIGTPVQILGTALSGTTSVTFNGTSAEFNVVSPTEITTSVPIGATTGLVQVRTPEGTLNSNLNFQVIGPIQFIPVAPCRLVDTRQTHDPIQGGTYQNYAIPQLGGCNIPANASAYSVNVTVVPRGRLNYLTIWPASQPQPVVSTMNSLDGRIKANAAIVSAGVDGELSVFATDTTDFVLDIDGYFGPAGSQTYEFYPLTPCRVIDTRKAAGPLNGPFLSGMNERDFPILESDCGIPGTAQAYSLNFTVVPHPAGQPLGYLTAWPQGQTKPTVSTLNNLTATDVANAAIVPAGTDGGIAVYPSNDTDFVADVNGYFAASGPGGLQLYPVSPCRVLDTRKVGNGDPFTGEFTVNVVGSACAPPASAQAYVFNATVVPVGSLGYLTLWPDGEEQPLVSTLNALDGAITSNMAIVPTQDGSVDAYASNLTQLVLDLSGCFAP